VLACVNYWKEFNMDDMEKPDPQIERIAAPLRRQERLADGFEQRLMGEVRRSVLGTEELGAGGRPNVARSWWTAPRSFSLSPLAAIASAAVFAAVVAASTFALGMRQATIVPPVTAASVDTVHIVRFVFLDSTAKHVALVGDFNGWAADATPLVVHDGTGMWTASVALRPGQHEYAFIVDGKRWAADPLALTTTDEFGTPSSRLAVGTDDISSTE
jgi:hypothetical protein